MCQDYREASLARTLKQTAEILRPTENRDRYGAVSSDKTTVIHRYSCRVMPGAAPQSPAVVAEKSAVFTSWRIIFPLTADIRAYDKIRIAEQVYEVLDTDNGRADASVLTVFARKMI